MDELLRPPIEETKRRWKNLERDLADKLAGWLTIASGAKWDKGDAKSYLFLGECKYRWAWSEQEGFYMPLDLQWLEAIWRHAQPKGKVPLLALEWGDGSRACVMPYENYSSYVSAFTEGVVEDERRIVLLPQQLVNTVQLLYLPAIEIPEIRWALFPWDELSWLLREELEERKRLGKQSVSKFKGGRTLPKTPFPKRSKK